jgi:hypothetical protein
MKLFIHAGLPKSATTYIQSIAKSSASSLAEGGIFYPRDSSNDYICNHVEFLNLVRSADGDSLARYLNKIKTESQISLCDAILFSHEELIFAAEVNGALPCLIDSCNKNDLSLSHIFTSRDWPSFFYSYMKQVIAMTGSAPWSTIAGRDGSASLAHYFLELIRHWNSSLQVEPIVVPLGDLHGRSSDIAVRFFSEIGYRKGLAVMPKANIRSGNLFIAEAYSGLVSSLNAVIEEKPLFSPYIEAIKAEVFSAVENTFSREQAANLLDIETQLGSGIMKLADQIYLSCSNAEKLELDKYFRAN